ncbi:MAG: hypothetical protein DMG14_19825, partial [Acidobacteria bacterium]
NSSPNAVNNFVEPQRGGGGFPGGGGGDFGGQRGGGDVGGQRGGDYGGQRGNRGNGGNRGNNGGFNQQNNGPTMTIRVNVQNLLNNVQYNNFIGTMTSSFFGRANNARNPRQIEAGIRFNF